MLARLRAQVSRGVAGSFFVAIDCATSTGSRSASSPWTCSSSTRSIQR